MSRLQQAWIVIYVLTLVAAIISLVAWSIVLVT